MNVKEQLAAKIETTNTILKFIEELENAKLAGVTVDEINSIKQYIESMRKTYRETVELINKSASR